MAQVPTGSTFNVATTYGAVKAVTAISNAAEAVVTCATHDFVIGDVVVLYSGWERLNRRAFRVKSVVAGTSFVLENVDTTDLETFPVGSSAGTVKKVTAFTQIPTIMNPSSSGGDPKPVNYKFLESETEYSINDGFSATVYTAELDADVVDNPGYVATKKLTDNQADTILKIVTKKKSFLLLPCTVALNEAISIADGQILKVKVTFNGNARLTRYSAPAA